MKLLPRLLVYALLGCAASLALFILLLHLAAWYGARAERSLFGAVLVWKSQPDGTRLATYQRIFPRVTGTLIFVHGTPATASAFSEQMRADFPGFNLIAYDRPGFGKSPGGRQKANLAYQSQTLVRLIASIPTPKIVLIGHSYGGPVVLQAAAEAPQRVSGVILIGGSVSPAEEQPWMIQYLGDLPGLRLLLPEPIRSANEELLGLKQDLLHLQRLTPQVRCPVLMLHGMEDPLVPVRNVAFLRTAFARINPRQFSSHLFPGYNHFMLWEHADEVNVQIRLFLSSR